MSTDPCRTVSTIGDERFFFVTIHQLSALHRRPRDHDDLSVGSVLHRSGMCGPDAERKKKEIKRNLLTKMAYCDIVFLAVALDKPRTALYTGYPVMHNTGKGERDYDHLVQEFNSGIYCKHFRMCNCFGRDRYSHPG